jgi:poly(hydroxyalkanoate) depolymerase family esterase
VLADSMNSVLRLTRAGLLNEATRAIQKALSSKAPESPIDIGDGVETDHTARPIRPLGEVVAKLGKLAPKLLRNTQCPKLQIPYGAKFLDGSFTCAAGTRTYRLYVPKSPPAHRRGLLVMLHGCTQNSADFAAGTGMNELADIEGMLVVYPDQTTAANSSACWNWFNPRDQNHGQGEPSIIAGITADIIATHNIDPKLVFIAGLSAGGAMAVVMGHAYPNLYSAVGVHSGLPYRSANDIISAFAAMRGETRNYLTQLKPRVIVFHGDADKTVHPSNAAAIVVSGNKHALEPINGVSVGGRKYTRTIVEDQNKTRLSEHWLLHGAGHAWSGGSPAGSYTDSRGPDASKEMLEFFLNRGGS